MIGKGILFSRITVLINRLIAEEELIPTLLQKASNAYLSLLSMRAEIVD